MACVITHCGATIEGWVLLRLREMEVEADMVSRKKLAQGLATEVWRSRGRFSAIALLSSAFESKSYKAKPEESVPPC
jgi:hypothetical protein